MSYYITYKGQWQLHAGDRPATLWQVAYERRESLQKLSPISMFAQ